MKERTNLKKDKKKETWKKEREKWMKKEKLNVKRKKKERLQNR